MEKLSTLTAAVHQDPYPFYRELTMRRQVVREEASKLWIASHAEAIEEAFMAPSGRVRPGDAPVPPPIVGSAAGDIFGRLVRMNDGDYQRDVKQVVSSVLGALAPQRMVTEAERAAALLASECAVNSATGGIKDFCYRVPVYAVGGLLGVPAARLAELAAWTADFVRCIAPGGTEAQIDSAKRAATELQNLFGTMRAASSRDASRGLFYDLVRAAEASGRVDDRSAIANAIGFLSQTYEATAGLIGNTLVALAHRSELRDRVRKAPELLSAIVAEVVRFDPPIQNTRRFLAADATIAGTQIKAGETILLVLAAANRDPARFPNPDEFDYQRVKQTHFTFGVGAHQCPGHAVAETIAATATRTLLAQGFDVAEIASPVAYRPSANARVPELTLRST